LFDRKPTALQDPTSPPSGSGVDSRGSVSVASNTALTAEPPARPATNSRAGVWDSEPKLGRKSPWLDSARFLTIWLPAVAMALYLKWYTMTNLGGFSKATRTMGYVSLSFTKHLSFFNGEIFLGLFLIPAVLLVLNRNCGRIFAAVFTPLLSLAYILLLAVQLSSLEEVGRYISLNVIGIAIGWGLHEPGANVGYLSARGIGEVVLMLVAIGVAAAWGVRRWGSAYDEKTLRAWKTAGEVYVLAIVIVLAGGWQTSEFVTPYHESTFVRAVVSLWREKPVDTGEFTAFNMDRLKQLSIKQLSSLSSSDLIARYRDLVHAPASEADPRYFGKEQGDNVLFFIMETTPDEFLPADDDMSQFPNMRRLREHSFVGTKHYTTLPFTQCALFSVFSSWYPLDTLHAVRGFPPADVPPTFLYQLQSMGYESGAFTPLTGPDNPDEVIYAAVGFKNHVYLDPNAPLPPVSGLDGQPSWKAHRIAADMHALHSLETQLDGWIAAHRHFVAAYLPQVGHFPYPDEWPEDSEDDLRNRGRAIIAMQDAWLGELMDFLQQRGQLDHTIILVFGDHGRRNARENPNFRRGTVDETAFHVPLLVYAPRALAKTEQVPWVTSHIDLAPTVLDLLGVKRDTSAEQGSPMWNPALAERTTFLFAQPLSGADGYAERGRFYMWHYYSDMVYANSAATFDDTNFIMRQSPAGRDVTSKIGTMVDLQATWQSRFAVQGASDYSAAATATSR
jgi:hypothetical protein